MIKKTIQTVIGILSALLILTQVYAQEQEPPLARVHYEFFHINDTTDREKSTKEEMVLYVGRYSTLYGSYASQRMMEQVMKQINDSGFDGNLTIMGSSRNTPQSYYTHIPTHSMQQVYQLANGRYLLQETYPEITWTIADESKEIGGYPVQNAIGHFAGREYEVWFTSELPFRGGPWKLQGLPGLVLEAASLDGEVKFSYAGIETDIQEKAMIGVPEGVIPTNPKALERLIEAYRKNPQAAMSAAHAGATSTSGNVITFSGNSNPMSQIDPSRIKSINVKTTSQGTSRVINNPIEKNR